MGHIISNNAQGSKTNLMFLDFKKQFQILKYSQLVKARQKL
jgi:hypothetical protein